MLVAEAVQEAAAALDPLRLEIADAIGSAKNQADARRRVAAVRRKYNRSTAIADALFVPSVMADLAGQLMVHEYEAQGAVVQPMAQAAGKAPAQFRLGDAQPIEAFLSMPWEDAVEYFKGRGILSERELSTLLKGHTEGTKAARKAMLDRVQTRVYELLTKSIEEGRTLQEFSADIAESADGLGITNQDPAYLQTVFRTNVFDAYGAGRHKAMDDPAVVEARPYRQIFTANDARVRDEHVPLEGLVYMADGPLKGLRSPFAINCRCSIVTLEDWDGEVVTELPPDAVAPGFGGSV